MRRGIMRLMPLPQTGFRRTPWKNGGGVSLDIAAAADPGAIPGDWSGMIWRFGRTAIAAPGPFSDLSGYERLQMVVAGSGLVLQTPSGEIDLREPLRSQGYDGGLKIISRLENGPVEVVNLIGARHHVRIGLSALADGARTALPAGRHILYAPADAIEGRCDDAAFAIDAGDALSIETAPIMLTIARGPAILASILPA